MKKIKIILYMVGMVFLLSLLQSCSAPTTVSPTDEAVENEAVQNADADSYEFEYVSTENANYMSFGDIEHMFGFCDYVVIASPEQSFDQETPVMRDIDGNEVDDITLADVVSESYTSRTFKINKVLKGEQTNLKEITVAERMVFDGKTIKIAEGDHIAQENNKYLLFLTESNVVDGLYYAPLYVGKFSLKAADNDTNPQIDKQMLKQAKEKFDQEFE